MTEVSSPLWPALAHNPVVPLEGALVVRARSGDAQAFRLIFERHGGAVRRFLRDLLRDEAAADEATQETFVRAHRKLSTIRDSERLLPWLFGIARYVAMEQRRQRRLPDSLPELAEAADEAPTPEIQLLSQEADGKLTEALQQLSETRRTALLMRVDHGMAYEDIAEVMKWPVTKVKNEIHRGRLQLRQLLSRYLATGSAP